MEKLWIRQNLKSVMLFLFDMEGSLYLKISWKEVSAAREYKNFYNI